MRSFGKFVLGAFLGGIVGSSLAILFAPVSGSQIRERIYDSCTNIRNEVRRAAEIRQEELRQDLLERQKKI